MKHVFFRFYNLSEDEILNFIKEIQLINEPIIEKIVKTEVVNSNRSMNPITMGAEIKEALIYFDTYDECEEFHELDNYLKPLYKKYSDMSDISKDCDIHRRFPKDIVF